MNSSHSLNRYIAFILTVILLLLAPSIALAESIFLNDGSIIEGRVQSENESAYTVVLPNNIKAEIPKGSVLRVVRGEEYKKPVYIYKKDGAEIYGHIVYEGGESYTVRKKLSSPDELIVGKREVREVSATRKAAYSTADQAKRIYSEREAILLSLVPISSGSSLPGYTVPGALLCIVKTAGFASTIASLVYLGIGMANDGGENVSAYVFFGASAGVWISATIIDVLYSVNRIRAHNAAIQGASLRAGETGILLSPRIAFRGGEQPIPRISCDGVNIHVYTVF